MTNPTITLEHLRCLLPKPTKEAQAPNPRVPVGKSVHFQVIPGDMENTQRLGWSSREGDPIAVRWGPHFILHLHVDVDLAAFIDYKKGQVSLATVRESIQLVKLQVQGLSMIILSEDGQTADLDYGIGLAIKCLIEDEASFEYGTNFEFRRVDS